MSHLKTLVDALRKIDLSQSEKNIIEKIKPLLSQCLKHSDQWIEDRFFEVDEEQGFGSHLIAENEDHTLAVIITAWPQGRETPPHDHDTWAVIGCISGVEKNILWDRHDDRTNLEYADISPAQVQICKPGDIVSMRTKDIHSVVNPQPGVSVSLHIYGKHFNYTNRYQFNPLTKTAKPFIVKQTAVAVQ